MAAPSNEASISLRVAGAWSGEVVVQLSTCRLPELRTKIAEASGFDEEGMKLICGGRMLKDDGGDKVLSQLGVTEKSKLLVTKVSAAQVQGMAAEAENARLMEERTQRLGRLKSAADAMARRSGGDLFPSDGYELQLENQEGQRLQFSDEDRRALVMGLALHAKAGKLMEREEYKEALEVLELAEEAFSLCNKVHLEAVDNVSLLQIDTVWCLYMLKDVARLAVARERLASARAGLRKAHGAHLERLRMLQGGFCPELALYVRLETLEGVVAFHSGQPETAKQALQSAEGKYKQLQVSDEALVMLTGMGFSLTESRRALRVSGQVPERATTFALEQRKKDAEKREEDKQRRKERREALKYGKTQAGKRVNIAKVRQLQSLGYDPALAGEALRQSENDLNVSLNALVDPEANTALQVLLDQRNDAKRKRNREEAEVDGQALDEIVAMGFDRQIAAEALKQSFNHKGAALEKLLRGDVTLPAPSDAGPSTSHQNPDTGAANGSTNLGVNGQDNVAVNGLGAVGVNGPGAQDVPEERRDAEMEDEIVEGVTGDPFAQYDVDVSKEGEVIQEYLALLESAAAAQAAG